MDWTSCVQNFKFLPVFGTVLPGYSKLSNIDKFAQCWYLKKNGKRISTEGGKMKLGMLIVEE